MEYFNSILFQKSGPADKQHTYQSVMYSYYKTMNLLREGGMETEFWRKDGIMKGRIDGLHVC